MKIRESRLQLRAGVEIPRPNKQAAFSLRFSAFQALAWWLRVMLALIVTTTVAEPHGLARTPPMGWNPYNHFSGNYNESIVRAHA